MSIDTPDAGRVAIALLHYPVYDKNHRVVTTAVTNLDLHDIARAARTFGLCRYYVVTPVPLQHALAERIRLHWLEGWGAGYNACRKEAMESMRVVSTLDDAVADMIEIFGNRPLLAVTGARGRADAVETSQLRERLNTQENPLLLMFGTGWGLTEDLFDRADLVLEPILGNSDYNHLSVRSAVSIYLDRLFGR